MIIDCPKCGATYDVQPAVLGRSVRCTNCTNVWRAAAAAPASDSGQAVREPPEPKLTASPPAPPIHVSPPGPPPPSMAAVAAPGPAKAVERPADGPGSSMAAPPPLIPNGSGMQSRPALDDIRPGVTARSPLGEAPPTRRPPPPARIDPAQSRPAPPPPRDNPRERTNGQALRPDPTRPGNLDSVSWQEEARYDETPRGGDRSGRLAPNQPRRRRGTVLLGWLMLLASIGGIVAAVALAPSVVVQTLPGTARLYQAAGVKMNLRGLEIENVLYRWSRDSEGRPAVEVQGDIRNVTSQPVTVPTVVFVLIDRDGLEVFHWATDVRRSALGAGKTSRFQARIPSPPDVVRALQVHFASAR